MKNFQLTFSSYPLSHQVSFSVQATSEEAVEEFSQGMLYGIESKVVYDPRNECEANTSWYSSVSEISETRESPDPSGCLPHIKIIHQKLLRGDELNNEEKSALFVLLDSVRSIDTPKKQEIFFKLCGNTKL